MKEYKISEKVLIWESEDNLNRNLDSDYSVIKVAPDDSEKKDILLSHQYEFLDRVFDMIVDLESTKVIRDAKNRNVDGIIFDSVPEITEQMILMAYEVYKTDRRFHLKRDFDQYEANKVIDAYVDSFANTKHVVISATYRNKLTGYVFLTLSDSDVFENVLGVTDNSIIGKMTAFMLYSYMMDYGYQLGYKKYLGRVSASNIASLNLHINLGAIVSNVSDEYIYRR